MSNSDEFPEKGEDKKITKPTIEVKPTLQNEFKQHIEKGQRPFAFVREKEKDQQKDKEESK